MQIIKFTYFLYGFGSKIPHKRHIYYHIIWQTIVIAFYLQYFLLFLIAYMLPYTDASNYLGTRLIKKGHQKALNIKYTMYYINLSIYQFKSI